MGSVELGLFAAIMMVLAGLLVERAWHFRNGKKQKNDNPGNPSLIVWEVKQDVAFLKQKMELQSELIDRRFDELEARIIKMESREHWDGMERRRQS